MKQVRLTSFTIWPDKFITYFYIEMKYFGYRATDSYLLFLLILLPSCWFKNKQQNNSYSSVNAQNSDTIIPFSGYWLNENYLKSIRQFKSPLTAQSGSEFIIIPASTRQPTMTILDFHQGGPSLPVFKDGEKYQIGTDSTHEPVKKLEVISASRLKIGNNYFLKIDPEVINGRYLILEEILFKGLYTTPENKTVEFTKDGQVTGLDSFHYYSPFIDYYDEGMQIDQVDMGKSAQNADVLGFKFNSDTLQLYRIKCVTYDTAGKTCGVTDYGDLVYTLIKKH